MTHKIFAHHAHVSPEIVRQDGTIDSLSRLMHFFPQALAVIVNNMDEENHSCNVYAGMTSIFTQHMNRFWYLSEQRIMEMIAQIGTDHLLFGLDFPYNKEKEIEIALQTIGKLDISNDDRQKILGGNLSRVLGV